MTYTVLWVPGAEQELASLWLSAPDRVALSEAANAIDGLLRTDPEGRGESREAGRRILVEPPLGVIFSINEGDRTVLILTVWRINRRGMIP